MNDAFWQGWLGKPIKVWMGRGGRDGLRGFYFGVLDDFDEYAIFLRQQDGETAFLPIYSIVRVEPFDLDSTLPEGSLLRAALNPDEADNLLRPASDSGSDDRDRLLRPMGEDKAE